MLRRECLVFALLLGLTPLAHARELAGINVPDSVTVGGTRLVLSGAGVRERFFLNLYVAALYLRAPAGNEANAFAQPPPKRLSLHVLWHHVSKEDLTKALRHGFERNQTPKQRKSFAARLAHFATLFTDVARGDVIDFDFFEDGTRVSINGHPRGSVPGRDFNDAVLRIWLGAKPPSEKLKDELLGKSARN